jgi:hypothetical protein
MIGGASILLTYRWPKAKVTQVILSGWAKMFNVFIYIPIWIMDYTTQLYSYVYITWVGGSHLLVDQVNLNFGLLNSFKEGVAQDIRA